MTVPFPERDLALDWTKGLVGMEIGTYMKNNFGGRTGQGDPRVPALLHTTLKTTCAVKKIYSLCKEFLNHSLVITEPLDRGYVLFQR